jgi:hypothetical protein
MQGNPRRKTHLWRGLLGCVVAYALIINALMSGILGAEWVAQAAAGLVGEHCLTDSRAASPDPAPAGQPDDSTRCAFCILACAPAVLPAEHPSVGIVVYGADALADASDRDLTPLPCHPGKLPRGPPQRA